MKISRPLRAASDADGQALGWFVRRGRGLDPSEEAQFQAWLAADPAHAGALRRWEADWKDLDALPAEGIAALKQGIAEQKAAAAAQQARRGLRPKPRATPARDGAVERHRPRLAWMAAAAVVAMAVGTGWWTWQRPSYAQDFATARGEQRDVDLPDGSQLRLDTATHVSVVFQHGRRQVRLADGQAYFQVAHDPEHPFDVLAGSLRVTVLGTRFSVRYTPEIAGNDGAQVAVKEGRVQVGPASRPAPVPPLRADGDGAAVVLAARQQVRSDAQGRLGRVSAVPDGEVAAWRDNRISFDNTPLAQALAEFERYGATRMAIDPAVAALGVTGTFNPRSLDNFMRILPTVLPVRLLQRGGVMEIAPSTR